MFKTIALVISVIINIALLSVAYYYCDTNKLKMTQLYINTAGQIAGHYDRGKPVDRYYIESFLEKHKDYIKGHILDMRYPTYAEQYGHDVDSIDVLDYSPENEHATFTGDLQDPDQMPEDKFDSFILTQTLQYPFDTKSVMKSIHKMLRKDGAVLITVPVISQFSYEEGLYEESWRFTKYSLRKLLEEAGLEVVDIAAYGNQLSAVMFLEGIAVEDLKDAGELDYTDEWCPMLIGALAVKK